MGRGRTTTDLRLGSEKKSGNDRLWTASGPRQQNDQESQTNTRMNERIQPQIVD